MAIAAILGVVFGVLMVGGIIGGGYLLSNRYKPLGIVALVLGIAFVFLFIFIPFSFRTVDAGQVAVVKHLGEARGIRTSGTYFDFWVTEKYEIYDAKVQQISIQTQAYSNDSQSMDIQLYVQYQIQADKVITIATTYGGLDMLQSRIEAVAVERTKAVLSASKAEEIISKRSQISPDVTARVKEAITEGNYCSDIIAVVLTNIDFTDEFEKSVENKMVAEQQAKQAEFEKLKKVTEAEAALEVSKKEAEAKLYQATQDAEAQRVIAEAEAYAASIKIVELARSLGYTVTEVSEHTFDIDWGTDTTGKQALLNYLQYLEYLAKWNGELPEVVGDGSGFMITIPAPGSTAAAN